MANINDKNQETVKNDRSKSSEANLSHSEDLSKIGKLPEANTKLKEINYLEKQNATVAELENLYLKKGFLLTLGNNQNSGNDSYIKELVAVKRRIEIQEFILSELFNKNQVEEGTKEAIQDKFAKLELAGIRKYEEVKDQAQKEHTQKIEKERNEGGASYAIKELLGNAGDALKRFIPTTAESVNLIVAGNIVQAAGHAKSLVDGSNSNEWGGNYVEQSREFFNKHAPGGSILGSDKDFANKNLLEAYKDIALKPVSTLADGTVKPIFESIDIGRIQLQKSSYNSLADKEGKLTYQQYKDLEQTDTVLRVAKGSFKVGEMAAGAALMGPASFAELKTPAFMASTMGAGSALSSELLSEEGFKLDRFIENTISGTADSMLIMGINGALSKQSFRLLDKQIQNKIANGVRLTEKEAEQVSKLTNTTRKIFDASDKVDSLGDLNDTLNNFKHLDPNDPNFVRKLIGAAIGLGVSLEDSFDLSSALNVSLKKLDQSSKNHIDEKNVPIKAFENLSQDQKDKLENNLKTLEERLTRNDLGDQEYFKSKVFHNNLDMQLAALELIRRNCIEGKYKDIERITNKIHISPNLDIASTIINNVLTYQLKNEFELVKYYAKDINKDRLNNAISSIVKSGSAEEIADIIVKAKKLEKTEVGIHTVESFIEKRLRTIIEQEGVEALNSFKEEIFHKYQELIKIEENELQSINKSWINRFKDKESINDKRELINDFKTTLNYLDTVFDFLIQEHIAYAAEANININTQYTSPEITNEIRLNNLITEVTKETNGLNNQDLAYRLEVLEPKLKALHSLYQTVLSEKGINFEETSLEYGGIKLPALKLAPGTSSNKLNKFIGNRIRDYGTSFYISPYLNILSGINGDYDTITNTFRLSNDAILGGIKGNPNDEISLKKLDLSIDRLAGKRTQLDTVIKINNKEYPLNTALLEIKRAFEVLNNGTFEEASPILDIAINKYFKDASDIITEESITSLKNGNILYLRDILDPTQEQVYLNFKINDRTEIKLFIGNKKDLEHQARYVERPFDDFIKSAAEKIYKENVKIITSLKDDIKHLQEQNELINLSSINSDKKHKHLSDKLSYFNSKIDRLLNSSTTRLDVNLMIGGKTKSNPQDAVLQELLEAQNYARIKSMLKISSEAQIEAANEYIANNFFKHLQSQNYDRVDRISKHLMSENIRNKLRFYISFENDFGNVLNILLNSQYKNNDLNFFFDHNYFHTGLRNRIYSNALRYSNLEIGINEESRKIIEVVENRIESIKAERNKTNEESIIKLYNNQIRNARSIIEEIKLANNLLLKRQAADLERVTQNRKPKSFTQKHITYYDSRDELIGNLILLNKSKIEQLPEDQRTAYIENLRLANSYHDPNENMIHIMRPSTLKTNAETSRKEVIFEAMALIHEVEHLRLAEETSPTTPRIKKEQELLAWIKAAKYVHDRGFKLILNKETKEVNIIELMDREAADQISRARKNGSYTENQTLRSEIPIETYEMIVDYVDNAYKVLHTNDSPSESFMVMDNNLNIIKSRSIERLTGVSIDNWLSIDPKQINNEFNDFRIISMDDEHKGVIESGLCDQAVTILFVPRDCESFPIYSGYSNNQKNLIDFINSIPEELRATGRLYIGGVNFKDNALVNNSTSAKDFIDALSQQGFNQETTTLVFNSNTEDNSGIASYSLVWDFINENLYVQTDDNPANILISLAKDIDIKTKKQRLPGKYLSKELKIRHVKNLSRINDFYDKDKDSENWKSIDQGEASVVHFEKLDENLITSTGQCGPCLGAYFIPEDSTTHGIWMAHWYDAANLYELLEAIPEELRSKGKFYLHGRNNDSDLSLSKEREDAIKYLIKNGISPENITGIWANEKGVGSDLVYDWGNEVFYFASAAEINNIIIQNGSTINSINMEAKELLIDIYGDLQATLRKDKLIDLDYTNPQKQEVFNNFLSKLNLNTDSFESVFRTEDNTLYFKSNTGAAIKVSFQDNLISEIKYIENLFFVTEETLKDQLSYLDMQLDDIINGIGFKVFRAPESGMFPIEIDNARLMLTMSYDLDKSANMLYVNRNDGYSFRIGKKVNEVNQHKSEFQSLKLDKIVRHYNLEDRAYRDPTNGAILLSNKNLLEISNLKIDNHKFEDNLYASSFYSRSGKNPAYIALSLYEAKSGELIIEDHEIPARKSLYKKVNLRDKTVKDCLSELKLRLANGDSINEIFSKIEEKLHEVNLDLYYSKDGSFMIGLLEHNKQSKELDPEFIRNFENSVSTSVYFRTKEKVLDSTSTQTVKTYPAYDPKFSDVKSIIDSITEKFIENDDISVSDIQTLSKLIKDNNFDIEELKRQQFFAEFINLTYNTILSTLLLEKTSSVSFYYLGTKDHRLYYNSAFTNIAVINEILSSNLFNLNFSLNDTIHNPSDKINGLLTHYAAYISNLNTTDEEHSIIRNLFERLGISKDVVLTSIDERILDDIKVGEYPLEKGAQITNIGMNNDLAKAIIKLKYPNLELNEDFKKDILVKLADLGDVELALFLINSFMIQGIKINITDYLREIFQDYELNKYGY